MPIKARKLGSKKGIERSLKAGGGKFALRVQPDVGTVVRFITEPEEWFEAYMHFDEARSVSYPCIGKDDGCLACEEGMEARPRWFAGVYSIDEDRVTIFEMPKSVVKALYKKYDRYNTISDRNYEVSKEGAGLNTEYFVESLDAEHLRGQSKMVAPDIEEFLQTMYDDAMRQIAGGEEEVTSRGRGPSRNSRQAKSRRRMELDDEDEFEDDDLDDEDEDEAPRPKKKVKAPVKKTMTKTTATKTPAKRRPRR